MKVPFVSTLIAGRRYMKTWPMVKQLSFYFPEYRVIRATQLALPLMPLLAILAAGSQLATYGWTFLPQAITLALFFISLPVQGLLWLGWRAKHPLPLSLLGWCSELTQKLNLAGVPVRPLGTSACYQDMADILKPAFEKLDSSHWEKL